jgi:HEPN domain-containing protein
MNKLKAIENKHLINSQTFLKYAKEYYFASKSIIHGKDKFESVPYFLLTHSLELLFKAYINSYKKYDAKIHSLKLLLSESKKCGLKLSLETENVIPLIEEENEKHGFRYFLFESTAKPDLDYLLESVEEVYEVVTKRIESLPDIKSNDAVIKLTFSKPKERTNN